MNSFKFDSSSFIRLSNIPKTPLATKILAETTAIEAPVEVTTTKAPIFLHYIVFSITPSNLKANESGYKHSDIAIEFSIIPLESITITYGKTFIKTNDLAYFTRLKKHSKV